MAELGGVLIFPVQSHFLFPFLFHLRTSEKRDPFLLPTKANRSTTTPPPVSRDHSPPSPSITAAAITLLLLQFRELSPSLSTNPNCCNL
ncbi:hypothetical protein MTR_1160s0010 [Medicago truncatula]|uniref:Uncharacterized protein n=1 Tax=Medicago truncatula TaxID=3880 RepID=A0A072TCZ9_MEDTR|nr:hypothetical protein MTR_1160s0010 [Medicago truncatula]